MSASHREQKPPIGNDSEGLSVGFENYPNLLIESISPKLDNQTLYRRAEQMSFFMIGIQDYYIHDLGVKRIDPDPPPGDEGDIPWRVKKLELSGDVQETGLEYIGAFSTDENGQVLEDIDALKALLVLGKPDGLCTAGQHRPTEIIEWDVAASERGKGLGRAMLKRANIHPDDMVILDVAQPNQIAQDMYKHYGFSIDGSVPPQRHGIFDTEHITMHAPASTLLANLRN